MGKIFVFFIFLKNILASALKNNTKWLLYFFLRKPTTKILILSVIQGFKESLSTALGKKESSSAQEKLPIHILISFHVLTKLKKFSIYKIVHFKTELKLMSIFVTVSSEKNFCLYLNSNWENS